jgi:xanthine dehydrogenase YagS FAD-binding subunit
MKSFTNANARSAQDAVAKARQARTAQKKAMFVGGGSDAHALLKDRIVTADVIVNLKSMANADKVANDSGVTTVGGQITLAELAAHDRIRRDFPLLAEAAESAATPQIRNVGTLAGNVCQRPWCWYFRNGFNCYKAGGNQCFSFAGENQHHAIFGGGPSYIVHPSDIAPALVALGATFELVGPGGTRRVPASEFFVLPRQNAGVENVLGDDELLTSIRLPAQPANSRGSYFKVTDRRTWTHAVVSAAVQLQMDGGVCRSARVVLGGVAPIPWRLNDVEAMLTGQRITDDLAARAGDIAVNGARPLSKNAYKIPMTRGVVRRTILKVAAA